MIRMIATAAAAAFACVVLTGAVQAQQTAPSRSAPNATVSDTTNPKSSERTKARKAMTEKRTKAREKAKAEPSVWDKTKDMTRTQWNNAKGAWAKEKGKWRDCNAKAKAEKLSGTKRWSSIGSCMTS